MGVDKRKQHKKEEFKELLLHNFVTLHESVLERKFNLQDLRKCSAETGTKPAKKKATWFACMYFSSVLSIILVAAAGNLLGKTRILDSLVETSLGVRCVIPNNYFVWEATRPITDCNICANLTQVFELYNSTREEFAQYAYSSQPVVIRYSAAHWPAVKFDFNFFKTLFESVEGSYESVEEECQFLSFKTEFLSLRDVFSMSERRMEGRDGTSPWYVGWSVCHPEMIRRMRAHYPRPHFLPEDAEHSHLDYVFMGYQQGAVMHLDYISRLMWQAQLVGSKIWQLVPPPECDHVCSSLEVTVNQGDIIVVDTRQWYHDTYIPDDQMSLTVSSEYG